MAQYWANEQTALGQCWVPMLAHHCRRLWANIGLLAGLFSSLLPSLHLCLLFSSVGHPSPRRKNFNPVKANTQHTSVCYNTFNPRTLRPPLVTTLSLRGSNIFTMNMPTSTSPRKTLLRRRNVYNTIKSIPTLGVQVSRCVETKSQLFSYSRTLPVPDDRSRAGPSGSPLT